MTPHSSLGTPTQELALRLDATQDAFFQGLGDLGRMTVRASNCMATLESIRQMQAPVEMEPGEYGFPEMGLRLSAADGLAVHGALRQSPEPELALEFDPLPHIDSLSFSAPPASRHGQELEAFIREWAVQGVETAELSQWRKDAQEKLNMCPCCAKAAARRAKRPQSHPLFWILKYAQINFFCLTVRLISPQLDFSLEMLPEEVEVQRGRIIMEEVMESRLSLDLYFVHAIALKEAMIDGERKALLHAYNSHGRLMLEIACNGPDVLSHWRAICDAAK